MPPPYSDGAPAESQVSPSLPPRSRAPCASSSGRKSHSARAVRGMAGQRGFLFVESHVFTRIDECSQNYCYAPLST